MIRADRPYEVLVRPQRATGVVVKVDTANAQVASPLFRLSAELRTIIWEFVIGYHDIHIRETPCALDENWTRAEKYRHEYYSPHTQTSNETLETQQITKLTSHVCLRSGDWDRQYALSKMPVKIPDECFDESGTLPRTGPFCEHAISPYSFTHVRCSSVYGKRTTGTSKPGVQISQSCRKIYAETWHLPFVNSTFEMASLLSSVREDFGTRVLFPHQRHAVRNVHVYDLMEPNGAVELLHCFPSLRRLRISFRPGDCIQGTDEEWQAFRGKHLIENVEIIVGYDYDRSDNRATNREKARAAEELLSEPSKN
ncbi:hypothetical protein Slin15195_G123670 [Septoria linicola]|uniref:Uncharacterized protein n=1 Tax=Septoria linicola TaxID=215465 RepID=A0A9Q9B4Y9_9PEZI|nr:hypothetical protein Slin14017_G079870 [Septoria linicola]USW59048.1 hypothetical protein Slin15195_G123670 [Septoria linicola]